MNTVGQVQLPTPLPVQDNSNASRQDAASQAPEGKDQVTIGSSQGTAGKVLSFPRKVVEGVGGVIGGAVETVINVPAGFIGGMVEGVDQGSGSTPLAIASVLELGSVGAVAGSTLGLWGAIGGAVGGLILGGIRLGILHESGAGEKMSEKLEKAVKKAISNNVPTGKKAHDLAKNATEGAILGSIVEGREGWKTGFQEGKGLVSGVIEGTKGVAGVVTGKYGPVKPEQKEENAPSNDSTLWKVGKFVLSLPKKAVEAAVGLLCGTVGAAISIPVGLIQGIGEGASQEFEGANNGFYKLHRFMAFAELTAAGAAGGLMLAGGPLGLGVGLGVGALTGLIVKRLERKSGADKEITGNVSQTLQAAAGDNGVTESKVHDVFRNTIEGGMVGTAAGAKEGFKKGFEGGVGVVDGFVEGIKGFFGAVTDIGGKKN